MPLTRREVVFLGGVLAFVIVSVLLFRAGEPAIPAFVTPAVVLLELLYLDNRLHAWRDERRRKRRASGLCLRCGYNLAGNVSGVCPECGERTLRR